MNQTISALVQSKINSITHLFKWIVQTFRYIKYQISLSSKVSIYLAKFLLFISTNVSHLFAALFSLGQSTFGSILQFVLRLLSLVALILFICFIKSLKQRYILQHRTNGRLDVNDTTRKRSRRPTKSELLGAFTRDSKDRIVRVLRFLEKHYRHLRSQFSRSVNRSNIESIHQRLSWSYTTHEFEQLQWLNRSIQILWPSLNTLVNKSLRELLKKPSPRSKPPIETSAGPKLSIYITCRRKLNLLRKAKARVLAKGDEYFGQKTLVMIIYLIRKFSLAFKQYLVDQVSCLIELIASSSSPSPLSNNNTKREIELDIGEILRHQQIHFRRTNKMTKVKSAPPQHSNMKLSSNQAKPKIRFMSAPESGLACNSKRILHNGLVSASNLAKFRSQRQELARKINQAHKSMVEQKSKGGKQITIEKLNLGLLAPQITGIKFLDSNSDSLNILSRSLNGDSKLLASKNPNDMQLLIEFTLLMGKNFSLSLSEIPILGSIELTKLSFRLRLLITVNHETFGDLKTNLSIFEAPDDGKLMPILNYLQVTLVDVPQMDWHLRRATSSRISSRSKRKTLRSTLRAQSIKRRKRHTSLQGRFSAILTHLKSNLRPINIINHTYFKFLVHSALYCVQKWFQPFDILIGQRLRFRTLA